MQRFVTLIIALLLTGCGGTTSDVSNLALERGLSAEPESLDPQVARSVPALTVLADLYEGLLTRDARGVSVPGVAQGWALTEDGKTYRFRIRSDARWSDGSPVTSDDFVRAWRYLVDPSNGAFYGELLAGLEGFEAVRSGAVPPTALGVTAHSADQLEVRLQHPQPDFLERLTLPALAPRPPAANLFNGTYQIDEAKRSEFVLKRNAQHPESKTVAIETVRYRVFEQEQTELAEFDSGALDITSRVPRNILRDPAQRSAHLKRAPYLGVVYLSFNLRDALPVELREALYWSVDRQALTSQVIARGESPAWTLVPPGTRLGDGGYTGWQPAAAKWSYEDRVSRARELVAGLDALPPVTINYASNDENRVVAVALQQMWQTALPGLVVELNNQEFRVVLARARAGDFTGVVRGSWIADYDDPQQFLELLRSGSPSNAAGFTDANFDALLDRARLAGDHKQRAQHLRSAEQYLHEQHVVIPLYVMVSKHLVRERVAGWQSNALDLHLSRYLRLETE